MKKKLSPQLSELISKHYGVSTPSTIAIFKRLEKNGEMFHSEQADVLYGQIMFYTLIDNEPAIVIHKLKKLSHLQCILPHICIPVQVTTDIEVIPVCSIKEKCVFITTSEDHTYVFRFPCAIKLD